MKLTKNDPIAMLGHDKGAMNNRCPWVDDNDAALGEFGCHAVTDYLERKRLC